MITPAPTQGGPLGGYAISLIRTGVPLGWGFVVSWLIGLGLPASLLATYHDVIVGALTAVATGGWYAGWRWLETKLPGLDSALSRVLVVLALGHPSAPVYPLPATPVTPVMPAPPPAAGP